MKKLFIFINLIFLSFSILPNWNLQSSSKNLLESSNTHEYTITHRQMYELNALLKKTITKSDDGTITHQNRLYINNVDKGDVSFENIESFYKKDDDGRQLLCPMGSYDPINLVNMQEIPNNIDKNEKWNLKCYNHNEGYFFVYYFNNGEKQVYDLTIDSVYKWYEHLQLHRELYDFKLVNKVDGNTLAFYPMCALIKWDGYIQFLATAYKINDKANVGRDTDKNKPLIEAKTYSKGCFKNGKNDF